MLALCWHHVFRELHLLQIQTLKLSCVTFGSFGFTSYPLDLSANRLSFSQLCLSRPFILALIQHQICRIAAQTPWYCISIQLFWSPTKNDHNIRILTRNNCHSSK